MICTWFLYDENIGKSFRSQAPYIFFLKKESIRSDFFFLCTFALPKKVLLIPLVSEAYLEPGQTSMMKLFFENIERLLNVNYFLEKAPS